MGTEQQLNQVMDEYKDKQCSCVLLCIPHFDEGFYRIFINEDFDEEARTRELLEGLDVAKEILVKHLETIIRK